MLNHSASVDQDIVRDERIVYSYDTRFDEQRTDKREQGMDGPLEALGRYLDSESANT